MKRQFYFILSAALSTFIVGPACNKRISQSDSIRQALIRQASRTIDSLSATGSAINYRAAQPKTVRWDLAEQISFNQSPALLVPIVFKNPLLIKANFVGDQLFHLDYLTHLLFYKDVTGKSATVIITDFPDSNYFKDPTRPLTGIRFVEDWYGHPVEKLLYTADGKIMRYIPTTKQPTMALPVEVCYVISGYNYSPELDETSYWTEEAGCSTTYIGNGSPSGFGGVGSAGPSGGGGGGNGGNGGSAATTVTVLPGNSVIRSIKAYFTCFTNVGGSDHKYTVTVCVDQPDPGSRTPWEPSGAGSAGASSGDNPVNAGHVFLTLSETYGNTTITRNVGFYPATNVNPIGTSSQGTLNDDELHSYNIGGSFSVNNSQFFNILNYVSQGNSPGYLYDLNSNNCTTFAINAVAQGGITLPRTIGTWPGGAGVDPGDLGQDLKNINIPGMTLNLNGGTNYSHFNVGQCN